KVGSKKIDGASELTNVISTSRPGDKRKLTLVRKGKKRTISVTLAELPPQEIAQRDSRRIEDDSEYGDMGLAVAKLDARTARRYNLTADGGVLITKVDPSSDAAREGIRPGDVVVRIGDAEVGTVREYHRALRPYDSGDTVLLRVARAEVFLFFGVKKS
ncbi:MAG: PDZ domain-containing protein, partial [Candidatus Marinimicrobia bacterium]|nr:PDZ domain-containing protein [Candidatus Neomarinimicrobiota bacterium]